MASLKEDLVALRHELDADLPDDVRERLQRATQRLIDNNIVGDAVGVGEAFPSFSLPSAGGAAIDSESLLASGPLVVSFYRGGWCPYCNLELRSLQSMLADIRGLHAELVAVSPQLPEETLATATRADLGFPLLTDTGNSLAAHLGLTFQLPEGVADIYRSMGVDLVRINGSTSWTLPMPATYIVNSNGVIVDAFINPDYRVRREPADIIEVLKGLQD